MQRRQKGARRKRARSLKEMDIHTLTRRCLMTGKAMWRSRLQAEDIAVLYEAERGEAMNAYRCSFCRFWHIGHAKSKETPGGIASKETP